MGQPLAACCCLRGAPRGFRSEAALYKGPLTLPRRGRLSAAAEWCGGGPNGGHPADARPEGDPPLSVG